jgi:hypothetical protein
MALVEKSGEIGDTAIVYLHATKEAKDAVANTNRVHRRSRVDRNWERKGQFIH